MENETQTQSSLTEIRLMELKGENSKLRNLLTDEEIKHRRATEKCQTLQAKLDCYQDIFETLLEKIVEAGR